MHLKWIYYYMAFPSIWLAGLIKLVYCYLALSNITLTRIIRPILVKMMY